MPGFNQERINIKDLTIEGPEKQVELPFNSETEITETDWKNMENLLEDYRAVEEWHSFAYMAASIKILDPSREIGVDVAVIEKIKHKLGVIVNEYKDLLTASTLAENLKILDPDYKPNLDNFLWKELEDLLKAYQWGKEYKNIFRLARQIKVMDKDFDPQLTSSEWEGVRKALDREKDNGDFAATACDIKILDPSHPLELDNRKWEELKNELDECRQQKAYASLCKIASLMKILTAQNVEITNEGIKLTMPASETKESDAPPVPERKDF